MIKRELIIEIAEKEKFETGGLRHVAVFFAHGDIDCCPTARCTDCRRLFPRKGYGCPCERYSKTYLKRAAIFAARVLKEEGLI